MDILTFSENHLRFLKGNPKPQKVDCDLRFSQPREHYMGLRVKLNETEDAVSVWLNILNHSGQLVDQIRFLGVLPLRLVFEVIPHVDMESFMKSRYGQNPLQLAAQCAVNRYGEVKCAGVTGGPAIQFNYGHHRGVHYLNGPTSSAKHYFHYSG